MATAVHLGPRTRMRKSVSEPGWTAIHRIAKRSEGRVAGAFKKAALASKRLVEYNVFHQTFMNRETDPHALDLAANTTAAHLNMQLRLNMHKHISDIVHKAGRAEVSQRVRPRVGMRFAAPRKQLPQETQMSFNLTNPQVQEWIRTHTGETITGISEAAREAIKGILEDSFRKGIPTMRLVRHIKAVIGLNQQQVDAVKNLSTIIADSVGTTITIGNRKVRVPDNPSTDWVDTQLERYADYLLNVRAKMIARTETIAAANQGQQQAWKQAVAKGLIRPTEVQRVWIVTPDDRLCPICEELRGTKAPIDGTFEDGLDGPPAHPNCRCAQGLVRVPKEEPRAATAGVHNWATTQIEFGSFSALIRSLGSQISEDAVDPINGREMNPHVTVSYGLYDNGEPWFYGGGAESVRDIVTKFGPVKMKIGPASYFEGVEDGTCDAVFLKIDSPDLVRLHNLIFNSLPHKEVTLPYRPHLTLAYVKLGMGKQVAANIKSPGMTLTSSMLVYRSKVGGATHIFLGSAAAAKETNQ